MIDLAPLLPLAPLLRLKERLIGAGYEPGSCDPDLYFQQARRRHKQRCPACGGAGQVAQIFTHEERGEARGLAFCPRCGWAQEL